MPIKKLLLATVFSLPLVFLLILPHGTLDTFVTAKDIILAAPFVLEFMSFYALYEFTRNQSHASVHEQKLLIILVVGLFVLLGTPVFIGALAQPVPGVSAFGIVFMLLYALLNLIVNTKAVSGSRKRIRQYFARRYIWPGITALSAMLVLLLITSVELNAVALYFIVKNYVSALSTDS